MRTVGEILIEARSKKNLSLDQVEKETKIRKKIIKLLEEGAWDSLAPTYTKGLLRNYASYLDLDQKKLLAFFRREYDERKQIGTAAKGLDKINSRFRLTPAALTIVLIGAVVAAVSFYLFFQYRSFTAPPFLEIQEPKDKVKITSLEVNVVGRTLNDSILKINGEQVQVSPGGAFSVPVGLKEGINTLTITAANRFGKISTVKRMVIVDLSSQKEKTAGQKADTLSLKLEITQKSTFLTIEIDGKITFEGLMLAGSVKDFEAKEGIKIISEDAGNTKVTFKDQTFVLGKKGENIEREFTNSN